MDRTITSPIKKLWCDPAGSGTDSMPQVLPFWLFAGARSLAIETIRFIAVPGMDPKQRIWGRDDQGGRGSVASGCVKELWGRVRIPPSPILLLGWGYPQPLPNKKVYFLYILPRLPRGQNISESTRIVSSLLCHCDRTANCQRLQNVCIWVQLPSVAFWKMCKMGIKIPWKMCKMYMILYWKMWDDGKTYRTT